MNLLHLFLLATAALAAPSTFKEHFDNSGFDGSDMGGFDMDGSDMYAYDKDGSDMDGSDMGSFDMDGSDMDAYAKEGSDMGGSDMGGSDMGGSDMDGSDMGGSDMGGSDMDGSDMGTYKKNGSDIGSDMGGSDMDGSDMDGSDMEGSDFDGSDYEDFSNLTLNRAAEERAINTCNCAPVSSSDRIVGGKEVNPKYKLPYQVLVSPCNKQGGCFMCGGTILNKRYVVTAAHCLYDGQTQMTLKGGAKFRVMVGEHDHCKAQGSFVLASVVHKHPNFDIDSASVDNDIAILKLSKDLTFSDKIKPACLPTNATKDYSGKASTVSGWGGTKANTPMEPVDQPRQCALKETIINILKPSSKKCSDFIGDSSSTTLLCGWAKGSDACQGDSGGPLTVAENGKYVLLGVVSYGSGCATENPGVYARVQGFLPWIKNIIADGECYS